jgi:uncharacterized repeat protein (TIGR02543 family)
MMKKRNILIGIGVLLVVILFIVYLCFFRTFTVTFAVGLGPGIQAQEVRINTTVAKPDDPTYSGYNFLGWYLDNELYDFDTKVTKNITLTAKWEENVK